ncbi:hypothetical protein BCV70DRAFT_197148 [Testicularia cyperi]|uniref:Thioesterase domain-containing protein n=1 Tax=Testicularia cyperi TaxID=1882483 RepID=A0A317Y028_9BASI|nr:hypothetical protein BCV70DRAFT_197148 [Testicularia cyperi]
MPPAVPKSLQDATQDAVDMVASLADTPGYSRSAIDPSICVVAVERTGLDQDGKSVREAADVDASEAVIKLAMKSPGKPDTPTQVRKDIHAKLVLRMRVNESMDNNLGNMHGGCGATIVDNVSSMVLYLHTSGVPGSPWSFLGVSQNINVLYLNACPIGSVVEIETYSAQVGRSIALLVTDIYLVQRDDGQQDDGESPLHNGKWKRIRKTLNGSHTKVDNSAHVKL